MILHIVFAFSWGLGCKYSAFIRMYIGLVTARRSYISCFKGLTRCFNYIHTEMKQ